MNSILENRQGGHACLPCFVCVLVLAGCDFRSGPGPVAKDDPAQDFCAGTQLLSEEFETGDLDGSRWTIPTDGTWSVEDGWLHSAPGNKNAALWLQQSLPENVRIEFDARSESVHGDLKVEVFGDGKTHESGYVLIFGGWKNSLNVIARLDEHGKDRKAAPGEKVKKGATYKMAVVRNGSAVRFYSDRDKKTLLMEFADAAPLRGAGHDRFAFNNWDVPVYFDNVRVVDLGSCK